MLKPRRLLRGEITYSAAKEEESNVLHKLSLPDRRDAFFDKLERSRDTIHATVAHHLGIKPTRCYAVHQDYWRHGSFNVCVPVAVDKNEGPEGKMLMLRIPLPYKVGEAFRPGNCDEKVQCEAGTYAWLGANCPNVPIPHLYGFGLSSGQKFTALEHLSFFSRCLQYFRRKLLTFFGYPVPSRYISHRSRHQASNSLGIGYILIDYIQGEMLSKTWDKKHCNKKLRTNLFRGLSRMLLEIGRIPQPRIGSFTIDEYGYLNLSNRPLTLVIQDLENEDIPLEISRKSTYSTVDSYVIDTLACHDSRIRHQPNALLNVADARYQLSALSTMKSIFPHMFRRNLRRGPFAFALTDLHQSNIFVDDDWNVKCVIDLEWAASRPIEMLHPPRWLTSQAIDEIEVDKYNEVREEFMEVLEAEEERMSDGNHSRISITSTMRQGWDLKTFWFSLALVSPTGIFHTFYEHIQPLFAPDHYADSNFCRIAHQYWTPSADTLIASKLKDKQEYDARLLKAFEVTA